ncbi:pyridoxal phosphate-dependent aminotransferase family protein [Oxalobacteraceae bacterium OTU3REALA1]|nr:pyridoxal phosphate-dependent aminotransferase family protein [Oxalobacteraceae bacterium OTU3REALA1]
MQEDWNPADLVMMSRRSLHDKLAVTNRAASVGLGLVTSVYARELCRASNTEAEIHYLRSGTRKLVTMFGSNNYLGLASHEQVLNCAIKAARTYGVGLCGSSFLNGYSSLQRELEEATAALKNTEDCIVFPSGYAANLSWASALLRSSDSVLCDDDAHMSFREGARANKIRLKRFAHNDLKQAEALAKAKSDGDRYIFVEGLYSMRGDSCDAHEVHALARDTNSILVVDDAHGTGTMGPTGRGTTELMERGGDVLIVGTYSKALGANGGFICSSKPIVNCLRILAPSYMFSAALSPASMAGALEAIRILLNEPARVQRLRKNCIEAHSRLKQFNCISDEGSPILFLRCGPDRSAMEVAKLLEIEGFFVNPISFPAVSLENSGIRINISSEHTSDELQRLFLAVEKAWQISA